MTARSLGLVVAAACLAGCARGTGAGGAGAVPAPAWQRVLVPVATEQASGTTALLQAVSAVNDSVVWVSGHRATWARTTDGGATWHPGAMTGADTSLQFRDVHAVDATTAYLLAAGPGASSRIYKTTDAGASWQLQFRNADSAAFFDCFDFWDARHGIAVSDAVRGRLVVIATDDGGAHWTDVSATLPPALEGEGAFAASGTCLVTRGRSLAWIGTGAQGGARVYRTTDRGRHWAVVATPIVSGQAAGIETIAFRDDRHGMAMGGRISAPQDRSDSAVAFTWDGGATWQLAARPPFAGSVYGSAYVPGFLPAVLAAGPGGLAWSPDEGSHWQPINVQSYWAVGFGGDLTGWAVGPRGRITRLDFQPPLVNTQP